MHLFEYAWFCPCRLHMHACTHLFLYYNFPTCGISSVVNAFDVMYSAKHTNVPRAFYACMHAVFNGDTYMAGQQLVHHAMSMCWYLCLTCNHGACEVIM